MIGKLLATGALAAAAGFFAFPSVAQATDPQPHDIKSACNKGWYVNPDENGDGQPASDTVNLMPTQVKHGFLFKGPSLVHHRTGPWKLKFVPRGSFGASVKTGVAPLFKMETQNPYSTINKTSAGTFWSSKIVAGPGSQAAPVAKVADLAELSPYTKDTVVYSFGVGYAKDTGNEALVKWIKFGPKTYWLRCVPRKPHSPSPSTSSSSPTPTATTTTTTPTTAPTTQPTTATPTETTPAAFVPDSDGNDGSGLPVTGAPVALLAGLGAIAVAAGIAGVILVRRRTVRFTAR